MCVCSDFIEKIRCVCECNNNAGVARKMWPQQMGNMKKKTEIKSNKNAERTKKERKEHINAIVWQITSIACYFWMTSACPVLHFVNVLSFVVDDRSILTCEANKTQMYIYMTLATSIDATIIIYNVHNLTFIFVYDADAVAIANSMYVILIRTIRNIANRAAIDTFGSFKF